MSKAAQSGYQRLGFENPPCENQAPPPYEMAVKQLQLQQPTVVSSPVTGNSSTTVTVEGGVVTATPAPYTLDGCCGMGNEKSALSILYVLLAVSLVAVVASTSILTLGVANGFTDTLIVLLILIFPTVILFPGSLAAVTGVFNGKTSGLSMLLMILGFYVVVALVSLLGSFIIMIATCLYAIVMHVAAHVNDTTFDDAELKTSTVPHFIVCVLGLAYITIVAKIITVLSDYHTTIHGSMPVEGGVTAPHTPYTLDGCFCMGNKKSALAILYVLLTISLVAVVASISIITLGVSNGFTRDLIELLIYIFPTAILFPGSLAAVSGLFNGKTTGLSLLLSILIFYSVVVLISMMCSCVEVIVFCLSVIVKKVTAHVYHTSFDDANLMKSTFEDLKDIGLGLVYFFVLAKMITVLIGYRETIRGRASSTAQ